MTEFGGEQTRHTSASVEACFAVASDVEAYPGWHAAITAVHVLARDAQGRPVEVDCHVSAAVATVTVRLAFTHDEPAWVRGDRVSGDLRSMWAQFDFGPAGDAGTAVTYASSLDPGRMLSMLAKGPGVADRISRHLVDEVLERFVEAVEQRRS